MKYYKEDTGDYLAIHGDPFCSHNGVTYEGRATNIIGMPESMATTSISHEYLEDQTLVNKADVPTQWLEWF